MSIPRHILLPSVALVTVSILLIFPGLGNRPLNASHEARAAQNAATMLEDGDWTLPVLFDHQVDLQKPPLYYWLVALLASWTGRVDAWTVRLPAALAALGCIALLALLGWHQRRPLAGLLAGWLLLTSVQFHHLAGVGRIDMPLTLAVSAALVAFYIGHQGERGHGSWLLVGWLALAAGVLLKGPIALVLVVVGWWGGPRREPGLYWGLPLFLLLTLPWFLIANQMTHGALVEIFFGYHNLARGLGGADDLASYPWWYYGPMLVLGLAPWSLALPFAVGYFLHRGHWREDRLARFGLAWFFSMVLVLSCFSFKRADYLLPAYPGALLFLACVAERWWLAARQRRPAVTRVEVTWLLLGLSAGLILILILAHLGRPQPDRGAELAAQVRQRTSLPVVLFRVEDHNLAFHLGRPLATVLEWENLAVWLQQKQPFHFILPQREWENWPRELDRSRLVEVLHHAGPGKRGSYIVCRLQPP